MTCNLNEMVLKGSREMRVLFCNIAWMNYYKGNLDGNDQPKNGGSYVLENGDAHEKYNFAPVYLSGNEDLNDGEYCLGFFETKSTNGKTQNQMNIEKIDGCSALKNEKEVDDVLVIYCAKYPDSSTYETYVVGWYKHAKVFRNYEVFECDREGGDYRQLFNAIARKEDCVLLPRSIRRRGNIWRVPRKKGGFQYGFGQSNVWYASEKNENLKQYLDRIVSQIEGYDGENWVIA